MLFICLSAAVDLGRDISPYLDCGVCVILFVVLRKCSQSLDAELSFDIGYMPLKEIIRPGQKQAPTSRSTIDTNEQISKNTGRPLGYI